MNNIKKAESVSLTTLEIADMMEMQHWQILRKLDGREVKGKHIKGYVEILADNQMVVSDFFIRTTYKDESGKENRCYKVTRMGCEFLANKFTGEKGVVFTALYVKRFHEMEEKLWRNERFIDEDTPFVPRVPIVQDWYERNKGRMYRLCRDSGNSRSYLYHCILNRLSERYDLNAAREIYKNEVGSYPEYPIDIVKYFPELEQDADKFLDRIERMTYR